MKLLKKISIRSKIIIITIFVNVIGISVGLAFLTFTEINIIKKQMASDYMLNTILVKERLAAPMSFGMDDDYAEIMKMFGQVRYVNFAVALDTNRVIVANFNLKDEKVDKNIQFQKTYNYVGNQLIITLPIIHTKSDGNVENYGLLVVHISDFEIRYRILNFVKTSIFVFFWNFTNHFHSFVLYRKNNCKTHYSPCAVYKRSEQKSRLCTTNKQNYK